MPSRSFSSARTLAPAGSGTAAATADLFVSFGNRLQTITGFGVADAFLGDQPFTNAQADMLFDANLGIGLTYLRTGMDSGGNSMSAYSNYVKAAARGAKLWMAPWTAAAGQKDNGSEVNGGHLLPGSYNAWATTMAGFQATVVANGGPPLFAVSVQNEPDFTASYVSMLYTPTEMVNFIKVLGPKLAALSPAPLLMAPELANWNNAPSYMSAIRADSTALALLGILGNHQYSGAPAPFDAFRPIWETEFSYFNAFDPSMTNALQTAQDIRTAIVTAGVSAWHWWWWVGENSDNEGLVGSNADPLGNPTITKRLYTFGNYSKFVRPNMSLCVTSTDVGATLTTAYLNASTGAFAIVVINPSASSASFNIGLVSLSASSVVPWITDATRNLVAQTAVPVVAGSFAAALPASSVVTFVGTGS